MFIYNSGKVFILIVEVNGWNDELVIKGEKKECIHCKYSLKVSIRQALLPKQATRRNGNGNSRIGGSLKSQRHKRCGATGKDSSQISQGFASFASFRRGWHVNYYGAKLAWLIWLAGGP